MLHSVDVLKVLKGNFPFSSGAVYPAREDFSLSINSSRNFPLDPPRDLFVLERPYGVTRNYRAQKWLEISYLKVRPGYAPVEKRRRNFVIRSTVAREGARESTENALNTAVIYFFSYCSVTSQKYASLALRTPLCERKSAIS